MPKFVCQHCGMITDNPEIVPHIEKDAEYRFIRQRLLDSTYPEREGYEGNEFLIAQSMYAKRFNHSITCPVCGNETRFWREEPFPTDAVSAFSISRIDPE